jgi:hypothetical protein
MSNLLDILPKLTELDRKHIGFWLNGPGGKTPSVDDVALLDRAKLKQAAQEYFDTYFVSEKSWSSTSRTYDKLFGGGDNNKTQEQGGAS